MNTRLAEIATWLYRTLKTSSPGARLALSVRVRHPEMGDFFTATLAARRCSPTEAGQRNERSSLAVLWRYPRFARTASTLCVEAASHWHQLICHLHSHVLFHHPLLLFIQAHDCASMCRYGFMPHRVAVWIYWHAFKLWQKGVPFHSLPSGV